MRCHTRSALAAFLGLIAVSTSTFAADVLLIAQSDVEYDGPMLTMRHADAFAIQPGHTLTSLQAKNVEQAAELIKSKKPAAVVVLRSLPQADATGSVATGKADRLKAVVDEFNVEADVEKSKMELIALPADDEVVKAAKAVGADVEIVTVARVKNPMSLQARIMRHVLRDTLAAHGAIDPKAPEQLLPRAPGKMNVAVFDGGGSGRNDTHSATTTVLSKLADVQFTPIGAPELQEVDLKQFDVLMFPGGSGSGQAKAIGTTGATNVRAFIENGGGYVGTCAGAYLGTCGYNWSLKIINLNTVDSKHWKRGVGPVQIELTDEGRDILGGPTGEITVNYANGPLLGPGSTEGLPNVKVLAYFRSDMAKGVPGGVMPNTPAIVASEFGKGRVILISPHPEKSEELHYIVEKAVRWVNDKPKTASAQ